MSHQKNFLFPTVVANFCVALFLLGAPALAQFTTIINVPTDVVPNEIGSDTQLNLFADGDLGTTLFNVGAIDGSTSNSQLNVSGGTAGRINVNAGGTANVSGGIVSNGFFVGDGGQANITGGEFGNTLFVNDGGFVDISGGRFVNRPDDFWSVRMTNGGGQANITGGVLGSGIQATRGSEVTISGGVIGGGIATTLDLHSTELDGVGGSLRLVGGDYRLDGQPIAGLVQPGDEIPLNIAKQGVLTGVYADGTPFAFAQIGIPFEGDLDRIVDGTLTLQLADLPETPTITIDAAVDPVPQSIRGDQTLRVTDGGIVPAHFRAGRGSNLLVESGGMIGAGLAVIDATVTITGGTVGERGGDFVNFGAFGDSEINISGGEVRGLRAFAGVAVNVSESGGGSMSAYPGSQVNITGGNISLTNFAEADISAGSTFLRAEAGSVTNVTGGTLRGTNVEAGSVLNISGGELNAKIELRGTINMSGGKVSLDGIDLAYLGYHVAGTQLTPEGEGVLNLSGGVVDTRLWASSISTINITGGFVRRISSAGVVNLSGGGVGSLGSNFGEEPLVTIYAGEIELNGEPVLGLSTSNPTPLNLPEKWLLTGVYPDGTPFVFNDGLENLQLVAATAPAVSVATIDAATDPVPLGIRRGQTLTVGEGGVVENLLTLATGSRLVVQEGGNVDTSLRAFDAEVHISGGFVLGIQALRDTEVTVTGGEVVGRVDLDDGSQLTLSGGTLVGISINTKARVDMSGGCVKTTFFGFSVRISEQNEFYLSGGELEGPLIALAGSTVDLRGTEFFIDDAPIPNLLPGETLTLTERDVTLSGRLADGSVFRFDLNSEGTLLDRKDLFSPDATLRLTLVPEPSTLALCLVLAIPVCYPRQLGRSFR